MLCTVRRVGIWISIIKLLRMIERASELGNGNFVLCGDFNLLKIVWKTLSTYLSEHSYFKFVSCTTSKLLTETGN